MTDEELMAIAKAATRGPWETRSPTRVYGNLQGDQNGTGDLVLSAVHADDARFAEAFNPPRAISLLERLQAAEGERDEALSICRDMVQAEDDLIAGLQFEGRHDDVLKLDFPIMHRMRALVARASDGDANV